MIGIAGDEAKMFIRKLLLFLKKQYGKSRYQKRYAKKGIKK